MLKIRETVTSLVEVWIEILYTCYILFLYESLPLWKCGLKLSRCSHVPHTQTVTSLAEVWIEIQQSFGMLR